METSQLSQLPEWAPVRFHIDDGTGSRDMLQIECPNCKQEFWTRPNWAHWSSDRESPATRPCPYCFRPAWLPGQKPQPKPAESRKPQVVIRRKPR